VHALAFLIDFDNTLFDADGLKRSIDRVVHQKLGDEGARGFWDAYERVRDERGVVDLFETTRRFAAALPAADGLRHDILAIDPRPHVRPMAAEVVRHLQTLGACVIVSDGDPVYQSIKIWRSGLADLLAGCIIVLNGKERRIADIADSIPAERYVVIDDKPAVLSAATVALGVNVTTVLVRYGRYAGQTTPPDVDIAVDSIDELLLRGFKDFAEPRRPSPRG